jgi:predicted phosphodiesterase
MGVAWSVSGLAKGVVEYADNPAFEGARVAKPGGLGLVPVDASALQVRLTGLEPATTYYYRTVTTPFTAYPDIYRARLGESVVGRTYAFTTLGTRNRGAFAMISDTHARWPSYERRAAYLKANPPALLVWNGDATNSTQDKETAVEIFLDPPVASADFAASVPMAFVYGNHDCRGSWMPHLDDVLLPRSATERIAAFAELNRNFAERLGDMALVGMDTGEDKPDAHPKWFGLANFEPYRRLQARWLEETLARPDIASAPFKVVFCHIPLYAAPDHPDHAHDGAAIDPHDWAFWSRECFDLWNPILEKGGVQLVVAGHRHRYRHDLPSPGRSWHQVLGGGHELGVSSRGEPDEGRFPTVVEGAVRDGRLVVTVHDVFGNRIADSFAI